MESWTCYLRNEGEKRYGEAIINVLSKDLRIAIPKAKGLTLGGLYYSKRFYLLYNQMFEILNYLRYNRVLRIFPQLVEKFMPLYSVAINA